MGRRPVRTLVRVGVLVLLSVAVFGWIFVPIRTYGPSMLPTYRTGSFHLVNRLAYLWRSPQRGEVVAVRLAGRHLVYVKRIVGLPGETVAFRDGEVWINGRPLDESYIEARQPWTTQSVVLGPDEFFVVGDNRNMPMSQHEFGRVKRERVEGPLLF